MKLTPIAEGIVWKNPYPSVRSRVAIKGFNLVLGPGEVLHSAQTGQARQSLDTRCLMLRSADYGKTWTTAKALVAEEDIDPRYAYTKAMLSRTTDGTVWALSMRCRQVEPEDPRWNAQNSGWLDSENFICRSADNGRTWSKPHYVQAEPPEGGFQVASSAVLELAGGEFMMVFEPFYTGTLEEMRHAVAALYSRDGGQTWGRKTIIAQDSSQRIVYFDPRMTRLADGRWICMFWTHEKKTDESLHTSVSYSEDGHVWTEPSFTPLWGFLTLPLQLADGRLLAVYNHRRTPQGIRCAVSEDAGRTWDMDSEYVLWDQRARRVTCEPARESVNRRYEGSAMLEMWTFDFGVPNPVQFDDGSVLVTFYATQLDHVTHQRYIRFSLD